MNKEHITLATFLVYNETANHFFFLLFFFFFLPPPPSFHSWYSSWISLMALSNLIWSSSSCFFFSSSSISCLSLFSFSCCSCWSLSLKILSSSAFFSLSAVNFSISSVNCSLTVSAFLPHSSPFVLIWSSFSSKYYFN